MRVIKWIVTPAVLFMTIPMMCAEKTESSQELNSFKDRGSYAMGVEMMRNLKRQGFDFDLDNLIRGMRDASADQLQMTDPEIMETLNAVASQLRMQKAAEKVIEGHDNREEEQKFLSENKSRKGVVALPSGLQYKIIKEGKGKIPTAEETVEINFRGTILDGTQFEDTYESGQPRLVKVSDWQLIAGLKEALKLMPVGSKWQLFIPSRLAYGQRGMGRVIGPNDMLIYELELMAIE